MFGEVGLQLGAGHGVGTVVERLISGPTSRADQR